MYELPLKQEEKKAKNIPFKVNFGHKLLSGKSYVRIGLPLRTRKYGICRKKTLKIVLKCTVLAHTVTGKISTKDQYNFEPELIEKEAQKLVIQGPSDKYATHITENQRYGWYQHIQFTNIDKTDKRIYFTRRMDHLIKLYLLTMDQKP